VTREINVNTIIIKLLTVVLLAFAAGWIGSRLDNAPDTNGLLATVSSAFDKLLHECPAGSGSTVAGQAAAPDMSRTFDPTAPLTPTRW